MNFTPGEFRHRYTLAEYEHMARVGAFDGKRTELLGGDIRVMTAMGSHHFLMVLHLNAEFFRALDGQAYVACQLPLNLDDGSQPQPDFMILRQNFQRKTIPQPQEVVCVVEVSDSTLCYDQTAKLKFYASSNILEYWIVDVERVTLEIYREPKGNEYLFKHVLQKGHSASLLEFPDTLLEWWGFDA